MIYRFLIISDEIENFALTIDIDSESTFFDLQKAIYSSINFVNEELSAFYVCSENWEKEQEIMPMDMGVDSATDTYLMQETKLSEFIEYEKQKLLLVFDMLTERALFIELKEIIVGKDLKKAVCSLKKGSPPSQTIELDNATTTIELSNIFADDIYEEEGFNEDELDIDGFGDFNFDQN